MVPLCRKSAGRPKPISFGKWVELMNIYVARVLCIAYNQYMLAAETVITNAACAADASIYSSSSSTSLIFVC